MAKSEGNAMKANQAMKKMKAMKTMKGMKAMNAIQGINQMHLVCHSLSTVWFRCNAMQPPASNQATGE